MLPDCDLEAAVVAAERARRATVTAPFAAGDEEQVELTASFGVAAWQEEDRDTNDVFARADEALYRAKKERNKVAI